MFSSISQWQAVLDRLPDAVNLTTLIVGLVLGAAGMLALQAILKFIARHWRAVLLLCAVSLTIAGLVAMLGGY